MGEIEILVEEEENGLPLFAEDGVVVVPVDDVVHGEVEIEHS